MAATVGLSTPMNCGVSGPPLTVSGRGAWEGQCLGQVSRCADRRRLMSSVWLMASTLGISSANSDRSSRVLSSAVACRYADKCKLYPAAFPDLIHAAAVVLLLFISCCLGLALWLPSLFGHHCLQEFPISFGNGCCICISGC